MPSVSENPKTREKQNNCIKKTALKCKTTSVIINETWLITGNTVQMSLEFSLIFSEFIKYFLRHLSSNLVNLQCFYQIWNSATSHIQKHGNFHQRLPKSQNPGVISDPEVWIAIVLKKGAY